MVSTSVSTATTRVAALRVQHPAERPPVKGNDAVEHVLRSGPAALFPSDDLRSSREHIMGVKRQRDDGRNQNGHAKVTANSRKSRPTMSLINNKRNQAPPPARWSAT
jgi:hypothetical protein